MIRGCQNCHAGVLVETDSAMDEEHGSTSSSNWEGCLQVPAFLESLFWTIELYVKFWPRKAKLCKNHYSQDTV